MKNNRLLVTLALGLGLTLVLLWMVDGPSEVTLAQSGTGVIRVATTGSDTPGCGSEASPCRTVQYAVDQALPDEEIRVAAGVYTGVNNYGGLAQVVYISKTVTVRGGYTTTNWTTPDPTANPTTLDAQGLGRVLVISGTIAPTVEGLRITGGDATGLGGTPSGDGAGGGVYVYTATATISNCVVYSNTAKTATYGYGGGLYLYGSAATLSGNTVQGNTASTGINGYGGGLFLSSSDATLSGNTVVSNTASTGYYGYGGGLFLSSSDATLSGNTVQSNTASTASQGFGGGLYLEFSAATLSGNTVVSNTASTADRGYGGGLYLEFSDNATLSGNTVQGNTASTAGQGEGGGLCLLFSDHTTLSDNTVQSNTASTADRGFGGGLCLEYSDATLSGNTVQGNTASTGNEGYGGGLYVGETATLSGNTVQSNTASTAYLGYGGGLYLVYSDAALSGNTVQGNTASTAHRGWGGGLYLSYSDNATLSGNTVVSNTASTAADGEGGGLYLEDSAATVSGNTVQGNIASTAITEWISGGGGLHLKDSAATLSGNTVQSNTASTAASGCGGGLHLQDSAATLNGNTVQGNIASTAAGGSGGGLCLEWSAATLSGNTVQGNTASTAYGGGGGGLFLSFSDHTTLSGNTVVSNTATLDPAATGRGGGLSVWASSPFTLTNNVVAGNHANTEGSGLRFRGYSARPTAGRLRHTTIADNHSSGQGVFVGEYATLAFTNTIIAGHSSVGITVTAGGIATLEATVWYSNGLHTGGGGTIFTGTVNVYDDPAFVDPAAWDYHLTVGSAVIDEGVNAGVDDDIDGDPRPIGTGYDIGADEYRTVGVQLAPDRSTTADPGTVVTYTHTLTNTGDYTDTFAIAHTSSQGWTVAYDTPITLGVGQTTLLVSVIVPPGVISGTVDRIIITATSQADPCVFDTVTDTTTVGQVAGVALKPNRSGTTDPGTVITYTHTITNTGNGPDVFAITHASGQGWTVAYDTPIALNAWQTTTLVVSLAVPAGAVSGTMDSTVITATSQADPTVFDTITDTTTVGQAAGVALEPNRSGMTDPGTVVTYTHTITNTGNGPDVFAITHASSEDWTVAHETPIALSAWQTTTLVVSVTVPSGAISGTVDSTCLTATSQFNPGVSDTVTDTTTVGQVAGVELAPNRSGTADPGTVITYTHTLTNTGNGPNTFTIAHASGQGWTVTYDTPIALSAGQTTTLVVSLAVPAGAVSGTMDSTVITATSQANPSVFDTVADTTTVGQVAGVELAPNRSGTADPNTVITYTHTLTNTSNGPDVFTIAHASGQGWTVAYDTPITLSAWQTTTLVVSLTVPSGAISGTMDSTVITATSQADPTVFDTVTDTTTVGQVAGVELAPNRSGTTDPGIVITYAHTITNTGNGPDVFTITHASSENWTVAYDTPIALNAWQTTTLVVSVTVPAGVISGTVDSNVVTATSQADPTVFDTVTDTTTVTVGQWDIYLPTVLRNYAPS